MYVVDSGDVRDDVERLPAVAAEAFAEFRAAVAMSPWTVAPSINPENDEAPVRLYLLRSDGGSALISYLVRGARPAGRPPPARVAGLTDSFGWTCTPGNVGR